jgi:Lanthionine synthetase C-like protein
MVISHRHILECNTSVADRLLAIKKCDSFGCYWIHSEGEQFNPITKGSDETLNGGNARPLLYLLMAYKNTGNQHYLEVAEQATGRIVHYLTQFPVNHFGVLSGNMGVALVLSYLFELSGNNRWKQESERLAKPCTEEFLRSRHVSDGLANGRAGVLLSLIFLYRTIPEEWVIDAINKYLGKITERARLSDNGIYWMDVYHHAGGLNGFFDGAAGIGLVLKVAAHCLENDMAELLSSQAFAYVQSTYDFDRATWKDLRRPVCTESDYVLHRSRFAEGDTAFFTAAGFDDSIAHGARGIAYCYQMADDIAALRTDLDLTSFSEQVDAFHHSDTARPGISEEMEGAELCALISYAVHAGLSDLSHAGISGAEIKARYLSAHFPRTMRLLNKYHDTIPRQYFQKSIQPSAHNEMQLFGEWINSLQGSLDAGFYERLEDVYLLELKRLDISKEPRSHAHLYMKQMHLDEAAQQIFNTTDELFPQLVLVINPDIEFYEAKWNWQFSADDGNRVIDIFPDNLQKPSGEHLYLLSVGDTGLAMGHLLTDLQQSLLFIFQEPVSIGHAMQAAGSLFEDAGMYDHDTINRQILSALRYLIERTCIVSAAVRYRFNSFFFHLKP